MKQLDLSDARFDGPCYDPLVDKGRLKNQILKVYNVMCEGRWVTLREIADVTGAPESSVSAQLRHLRKKRFGSHKIDKRRKSGLSGLWEYKLG